MSNYSLITSFVSKDGLISGNPLKLVKGADLTTEFTAVQTAVNTKIDGTVQYFPDGTAGQPSVGFTNNVGTGMFNAAGVLGFATGATQRLTISAAGAVAATGALTVAGLVTASAGLGVTGATTLSSTVVAGGSIQVTNVNTTGFSGPGTEIHYAGSQGLIQAYNRTASTYLPMNINGSSILLQAGATTSTAFTVSTSATWATLTNTSAVFTTAYGGVSGLQINNLSASGQSSLDFGINGVISGRVRSDYTGNFSLVSTSTGHFQFYSGGDFGVGTVQVQINASNSTSMQCVDDAGTLQTVGWRDCPQNARNGAYTCALSDRGKSIYQLGPSAAITIPANATIAYPLGTTIVFVNRTSDNSAISIIITTDTLILAGTATTGTRTLVVNGVATAIKVEPTVWLISGSGLT